MPLIGTDFFVNFALTRTLILGVAASSIVFLSSSVGMVSLAQYLLVGVAGFTIGNCVAESGKGLKLGLDPWLAVVIALAVSALVALVLGAIGSRTTGIYFLMLTLTYAVIGYYVFGQVTSISGFGGITGVDPPGFFHEHPARLYFGLLVLSVVVYTGLRALRRTPFGLSLEGIRDDPVRMGALGFNVPLHRTLAFTLAGLIAGAAGVFNIWWNGQIDPTSVAIGPSLDLLVVAVIGGIGNIEGAWLGAFVYVVANNYLRSLPLVDHIGITEARFNTVVGAIVLLIVVLSPEGLSGIFTGLFDRVSRPRSPRLTPATAGGSAALSVIHQPTAHIQHGGTAMKRRTARRGTVVASVAVVGLTVGAGAFVADAAHPASTAPTGSAAAASGEPIKLGVLAECEGDFGGFNEDVIAGLTLAMINQAGATSNSRTTATDGFTGAVAGGRPIDVVGVGCGDATRRPHHPGGAHARRAGRRRDRDRPALGRRGDRRRQLRQGPPGRHVHRRHRRVAGPDAGRAGAELLPLPRRRRAMERRPRRHRLQRRRLATRSQSSPTTTASPGRRRPASSPTSAPLVETSSRGCSRRSAPPTTRRGSSSCRTPTRSTATSGWSAAREPAPRSRPS